MRNLLLSLAAAGAALAVASPAAAQYYPVPQSYGSGYGNGSNRYGGFGQVRALQARVDAVEYRIRMLDRRDRVGDGTADRLREEADRIENRLHRAARYGLNPYEARDIQVRIARLEQRVHYAASRYGGYGRGRYGAGYDGDGGYGHRDHDGDRDDRYDHDGDRDDD